MDTEVIVGTIGRAHGIRGEVSVEVRTDEPERRFKIGAVLRDETTGRGLTITGVRWNAERLIVAFAQSPDRTAAEKLRGIVLVCDVADDERPDDPDEFYDRHLIGLQVIAADGERVGVVNAVQHLPHHDLLVVGTDADDRLIPFTQAIVPEIDLEKKTCTLADIDGLITDPDLES